MSLVSMAGPLGKAYREGYAVPAFYAWNAEVMRVILQTAERLRAPVILIHARPDFTLLPPAMMAEVARVVAGSFEVPAVLHLDHGDSFELVRECVQTGYASVMLDYSARSFEENAEALRKVSELVHPLGISVEGEIGHVGKADEAAAEDSLSSFLTDPREAAEYVRRSEVDLLAVSVGSKHGFRSTFNAQWEGEAHPWVTAALGVATASLEKTVEKWIRVTGAEGKA